MIKVAAPSSHPFTGFLPCASAVVLTETTQTKNAASDFGHGKGNTNVND